MRIKVINKKTWKAGYVMLIIFILSKNMNIGKINLKFTLIVLISSRVNNLLKKNWSCMVSFL